MSVAAVLDPKCKMTVDKFTFPGMYSRDELKANIKKVEDALSDLYGEYVSEYFSSGEQSGETSVGSTSTNVTIQASSSEDTNELLQKLLEDLKIISEEFAEYINSPSWNRPTFYNNDEEHSIQYKEYLENSSNAITSVLPTKELEYSLSMGDEHLSTIPEMESNELIKSSVKNLVPIPGESEEFSGELMPTSIINKERIRREHEEYISLMEKLLSINSFPHDLMPPAIESDDYDSEEDIHFLEELLSNDFILLPENESSDFDYHDEPSFPRPPPEPPDVEVFFNFEPDSRELISAVMNNIDELIEDECFDPGGGEVDVFVNIEDDDFFPFIFVIQIFLPYLTYPEVSPLLLSTESEDTIFDPGIST
nr:hypothetical protein [Tanacetum cinerariifolium]